MDKMTEAFEKATDPRPFDLKEDRRIRTNPEFSGPLPPEASSHPTVMDRRRSRESPAPHFKRLAQTWSGMVGVEITPAQAVMMLAAMKLVREWYMHDPDNITDAEGYLSLIKEVRGY